jgi:hypothetical protein
LHRSGRAEVFFGETDKPDAVPSESLDMLEGFGDAFPG